MAQTYTLTEAVSINMRIDNQDLVETYGPGDVTLPAAVADLLVAQGLATPTAKGGKKVADPAPAPTTTTESQEG